MRVVSLPRRLTELADQAPDRRAVTCGDRSVTRAELEDWAIRLARDLDAHGVGVGDMVTMALPNSPEWFATVVATWKLGAVPQPVSPKIPRRELEAILRLARPKVVVGDVEADLHSTRRIPRGHRPSNDVAGDELPDVVSPAWKAPTSGGSTGRAKLIVSGQPAEIDADGKPPLRLRRDGCLVMPGPLYHNGPLVFALYALLWGNHVVALPRFDAEGTLRAIASHDADTVYLVPTMMKRIWRLREPARLGTDVSSLRTVWHLAEPCPQWLKRAWIDWLGPDTIWELYSGTEAQALTIISGREWLAHPGSVGRLHDGEVEICDAAGRPVPAGTVGEVWLRSTQSRPTYRYIGATAKERRGGWESLGDMGWLDADGYLYLADRTHDMILSGGANLYPAEIEAALSEHPAVRSCVVVGLPDDDLGQRAHAIVEADRAHVDATQLATFLRDRLVSYKIPRSWELVDEPLRNDAGKVRRSDLRTQRLQQ